MNENSLKNLEKRKKFCKAPQGLDKAKSEGQIELSKNTNLLCSARTMFENANILPDLIINLKEEVSEGYIKNAIKFFEVIKETENNTTVNINQAVQVNKKDVEDAINIINELR